jgi:hypothetical protein
MGVRKITCNDKGCKLKPLKRSSQTGGGLLSDKKPFLIPLQSSKIKRSKTKRTKQAGYKKKRISSTRAVKKERSKKSKSKKVTKR